MLWVLYGYSLAFDPTGTFVGGFGKAFMKGVTVDSVVSTIPESVFAMFQLTFAIITPALTVGAFAERMKFGALVANGTAGMAMLVTQVATAAAALAWMIFERIAHGKPSALGVATGAIAGLVAITPAAGSAGPAGALLIGVTAAGACFLAATRLKHRLGYDDSLDVFGVYAVGGIVGAIMTGICAGALGGTGLAEGVTIGAQVWVQLKSVSFTIAWSGIGTFLILKLVDATVGLRVSAEQKVEGLDLALHDERAYNH